MVWMCTFRLVKKIWRHERHSKFQYAVLCINALWCIETCIDYYVPFMVLTSTHLCYWNIALSSICDTPSPPLLSEYFLHLEWLFINVFCSQTHFDTQRDGELSSMSKRVTCSYERLDQAIRLSVWWCCDFVSMRGRFFFYSDFNANWFFERFCMRMNYLQDKNLILKSFRFWHFLLWILLTLILIHLEYGCFDIHLRRKTNGAKT